MQSWFRKKNSLKDLSFVHSKVDIAHPFSIKENKLLRTNTLQIFLHIPKTGGTTIDYIFKAVSGSSNINYTRCIVPRESWNPPCFIRPGWTGGLEEVNRLTDKSFDGHATSIISGHFPVSADLQSKDSKAQYFCLVRNPIDREISSFNFHHQRQLLPEGSTLKQLIDDKVVIDNPQVRMIAGAAAMSGKCTEEIYERALKNLDQHFLLTATTEDAHAFIQALQGLYGLPLLAYCRAQVTGIKNIDKPDNSLLDTLEQFHTYDMRLYNHVKKRWAEWKTLYVTGLKETLPDDTVILLGPDYGETGCVTKCRLSDVPTSIDIHGLKKTKLLPSGDNAN
jgi:hypothetical protein